LSADVATKIVKPRDCILAFGIPTSEADFRADLRSVCKDFARNFNGLWARYEAEFIDPLVKVERIIRNLDTRVVHGLTLARFGALVATADVFILFTHWIGEQVEFADGLQPIAPIVEAIPQTYAGILDLCVCRSDRFAAAVRSARTGCLVRHVAERAVTPAYWLYFFMVLFKYLEHHDTSYLNAVAEVIRLLNQSTRFRAT
jgi:hypothetical protein